MAKAARFRVVTRRCLRGLLVGNGSITLSGLILGQRGISPGGSIVRHCRVFRRGPLPGHGPILGYGPLLGHPPLAGHRRILGHGPLLGHPPRTRLISHGRLARRGPIIGDGRLPGRGPIISDGPLPRHGSIVGHTLTRHATLVGGATGRSSGRAGSGRGDGAPAPVPDRTGLLIGGHSPATARNQRVEQEDCRRNAPGQLGPAVGCGHARGRCR